MASSPAYAKYPDHCVKVEPKPGRLRVDFAGETIAESGRSLLCLEGTYDPVFYVPRADVRSEFLQKTEHTTYCPFKGHASYYTIRVGDRVSENALWSYENPYDQVASLKDCAAFYRERVDALVAE